MNRRSIQRALPVGILSVIALLSLGAWAGLWAGDWREITGPSWTGLSVEHWLGTNRIGQDIFSRTIVSFATALEVGLLVGLASATLGVVVGATSGYFRGRWMDEALLWLTGCFESIPYYLLIGAVLFALNGAAGALQLALILSFWPAVARHARTRAIALREQEFITAGRVSGLSSSQLIRRHVLPHLSDLLVVQASLLFVAAIKTEVVLSFVGLAGLNSISFGRMLAEAGQDILAGEYQNFIAASLSLFLLIWSTNQISDRLQICFNPVRSARSKRQPHSRRIEPV